MHLYQLSEDLVQALEQRVREERNDSHKSQYQTLLQQQKQASASLKVLGQYHEEQQGTGGTEGTATTQDFSTEFATETYVDPKKLNNRTKTDANVTDVNKDSNK